MAASTGLLCKPKLIRKISFRTSKKKENNERVPKNTNDTFIYIVSMKKDHRKNHCKNKNVLGNMLNRVISKVLQLALYFCSIPGGTTAVKNLICKKIIYFEVSCCDWECLNDQTICALCGKEEYIFIVTPN